MTETGGGGSFAPKFDQPGFVLAVARFSRSGGDVVQNTFVFRRDIATGTGFTEIRNRLDELYMGVPGTGLQPVKQFLSNLVTGLTYYMRQTDLARGEAGTEVPSATFTVPNGTNTRMPPELAVCGSYRAGSPYTKRRRGRIYLGPLSGLAHDTTTGRITADCRNSLRESMRKLASESAANPMRWVIASRVGNSASLITEGYVDEHFDVQRRRDPSTESFARRASEWTVAAS